MIDALYEELKDRFVDEFPARRSRYEKIVLSNEDVCDALNRHVVTAFVPYTPVQLAEVRLVRKKFEWDDFDRTIFDHVRSPPLNPLLPPPAFPFTREAFLRKLEKRLALPPDLRNTDRRLAFRISPSTFLAKKFFTFGWKEVPPDECHLLQPSSNSFGSGLVLFSSGVVDQGRRKRNGRLDSVFFDACARRDSFEACPMRHLRTYREYVLRPGQRYAFATYENCSFALNVMPAESVDPERYHDPEGEPVVADGHPSVAEFAKGKSNPHETPPHHHVTPEFDAWPDIYDCATMGFGR